MDFKAEQVTEETEESVKVCCHDTNAEWVNKVHEAVIVSRKYVSDLKQKLGT